MILALGTNPNNNVINDFKHIFSPKDAELNGLDTGTINYKDKKTSLLLKKIKNNIWISFFGDMHKVFRGSVVKAIASTSYGYQEINSILQSSFPSCKEFKVIKKSFKEMFTTTIVSKKKINDKITEIVFKNKGISETFCGGMFLKLQNYENSAHSFKINNNIIKGVTEPIFLTGVKGEQKDTIKAIILNTGFSTKIINQIDNNNNVMLMGPLGKASYIPKNKNLVFIAGGVANLVTISLLEQAKLNGNKVIYIGGYKKFEDIFYLDSIKKFVDTLFISIDDGKYPSKQSQPNENIFYQQGNVIDLLKLFINKSKHKILTLPFFVKDINSITIAGSSIMMAHVSEFIKHNILKYCDDGVLENSFASVNSFMQCGIGGICSSCLQKYRVDGEDKMAFTCVKQEHPIMNIDFDNLQNRLSQNSLQERIAKMLLQYYSIVDI